MNDHGSTVPRLQTSAGSLWMMRRDAMDSLRSQRIPAPSSEVLAAMNRGLRSLVDGDDTDESADPFDFRSSFKLSVVDGVAAIPISGVLTCGATPLDLYLSWLCGGESYEVLDAKFRSAESRSDVKSVVVVFDTPGGHVRGLESLAATIASMTKPVAGFVAGFACSAGYRLLVECDEITAGPGSEVGSIGTIQVCYDDSAMLEKIGVKEYVFKSEQSPMKWPDVGTDEGREQIQSQVNEYASQFVSAVAKARSVSVATVLSDFGKGGCLFGPEAKKAGMVDRLGSLDDVMKKMSGPNRNRLAKRSSPPTKSTATAGSSARTLRSRPMPAATLRSKFMAFLSGSTNDADALTENEKLQALDAIGAAENGDPAKPAIVSIVDVAASVLKIEDTPAFKAQVEKLAAQTKVNADLIARLDAADAASLSKDAKAFATGLASPTVAKINPAQLDAVASLYGSVAKADASGSLLTEFKAVLDGLPTASARFGSAVSEKEIRLMESVARGDNPDAADPTIVAQLMKEAGLV